MCKKKFEKLQKLLMYSFMILAVTGLAYYQNAYIKLSKESISPFEKYRNFKFEVPFYGMKYIGFAGDYIDESLFKNGSSEKYVLNFMKKLMASSKNKVYLDIGANVGQHAMFMSKHADEVLAVEPYPPVLERLHNHIKINSIENIEVFEVGFGNKNDTLPFIEPSTSNHGIGTFSSDFKRDSGKGVLNLKIIPGDTLFSERNNISIIKIDIEGYERFALEGLVKTLNHNRPAVVMELNCNAEGGFISKEQLISTFPKDYSFYHLVDTDAKLGTYRLVPFDYNFEKGIQKTIIGAPNELSIDL